MNYRYLESIENLLAIYKTEYRYYIYGSKANNTTMLLKIMFNGWKFNSHETAINKFGNSIDFIKKMDYT